MSILLDTCALLWMSFDPDELSPAGRRLLAHSETRMAVAAVSFWEIAVKVSNGRLSLAIPVSVFADRVRAAGVRIIPADERLWIRSAELIWTHGDPADRLIVATAERERLTILTRDRAIRAFYPQTTW